MMFSAEGAKFEVLPLPVVEKSQKQRFHFAPPLTGFHLELGIGARGQKLEYRDYQMVIKSSKIGLAV